MNRNEVKVWLKYHGEVFADFQTWYDGKPPAARGVYWESCVKALKRIELTDACSATDRMLAGDTKRPFLNDDVVAAIIAESSRARSQRFVTQHRTIDGQQTASCPFCRDTGLVECWRRNLIDKMVVACSCHAGDGPAGRWRGYGGNQDPDLYARQNGEVQRYNPKFCYWVGDYSAYWMDIRARIEADKANGTFQTLEERKLAKEAENVF